MKKRRFLEQLHFEELIMRKINEHIQVFIIA